MTTLVYVVNQNGTPLMPCQPSKARKLLRDRRARVVKRSPFTIQLLWDCEEHVQEVVVGIDKGSRVTGLSCVGKGAILLSGQIHHRLDVKKKMGGCALHCYISDRFVKQIHSIYSNGYLAFRRVKGEPFQARPRDCQLLERGQTILWEKVS